MRWRMACTLLVCVGKYDPESRLLEEDCGLEFECFMELSC